MQTLGQGVYIYALKEFLDSLGAHADAESVLAVLLDVLLILVLIEQLHLRERSLASVENDIACEIEHLLEKSRGYVEQQSHSRRDSAEIPDVGHRSRELDVTHALTAHLLRCDFDAALLAYLALVSDALVLAAEALPVLRRTKDALTEKSVALSLQGAVVDSLRLLDLAVRPASYHLRGCETYLN